MKRIVALLTLVLVIALGLVLGLSKGFQKGDAQHAETAKVTATPIPTPTPSETPEPTPTPTPSPTPEPPSEPGTVLLNGGGVLYTTLDRGTQVTVVDEVDAYYVIDLDGIKGYIEKWLVRMGETELAEPKKGYARSGAKIYETAYCDGEELDSLKKNTAVQVCKGRYATF